MEAKLYVGNLSYTSSEDDLKDLFAQAGTVKSVAIIKDRDTGRSKGFGFVEMETGEEAQKAITMFHNYQFQQRTLTVNIARPREERPVVAAADIVAVATGRVAIDPEAAQAVAIGIAIIKSRLSTNCRLRSLTLNSGKGALAFYEST